MRRGRVAAAVVLTAWLAGIAPSIIWTRNIPNHGPQLYAWYLILGPMALYLTVVGLLGLGLFYRWAFQRRSREDVRARIAELEREVGLPPSA